MRDVEKERLPHPLAPLLKPLGMARRAKPSGLTGKHQKMFRPAAWTPDLGKSAAGITPFSQVSLIIPRSIYRRQVTIP
jgi:hypothetical protein